VPVCLLLSAHRAVIFAIAQPSCFLYRLSAVAVLTTHETLSIDLLIVDACSNYSAAVFLGSLPRRRLYRHLPIMCRCVLCRSRTSTLTTPTWRWRYSVNWRKRKRLCAVRGKVASANNRHLSTHRRLLYKLFTRVYPTEHQLRLKSVQDKL